MTLIQCLDMLRRELGDLSGGSIARQIERDCRWQVAGEAHVDPSTPLGVDRR